MVKAVCRFSGLFLGMSSRVPWSYSRDTRKRNQKLPVKAEDEGEALRELPCILRLSGQY